MIFNWHKQTRSHNHGFSFSVPSLAFVKFRILFKIQLKKKKSFNGPVPSYSSELHHPYMPSHALRSANQVLLTVPKTCYKSRGDRAFAALAPKMWNELKIRQTPPLAVKTRLKTHVLCLAFNPV